MSAHLENIDLVCNDVGKYFKDLHFNGLSFDVQLGIREALVNAVEHGSQNDPSKQIIFQISKQGKQLVIIVKDEGSGFVYSNSKKHAEGTLSCFGRGNKIMRQCFDNVTYNELGNEVELVKKVEEDRGNTMSKVRRDGDKVFVKLEQDIVASISKDLKEEFKGLLDGGAKQMVVDLDDVKMIDSSGLGVLIAAHNSLQKLGASLELLNISDDIRKLLQNMRLDKHFILQKKLK